MTRIGQTIAAFTATTAPACADQPLDRNQLSALTTGNTPYVTMPAGAPGAPDGGVAPIYYGADGAAAAQLPAGPRLVGTWEMANEGYCIDWDNGPQNSCSTLQRDRESFVIKDAATGESRGRVSTIATGNVGNCERTGHETHHRRSDVCRR